MGVKTRIGFMIPLRGGSGGSVELPEDITLYCPQCGTLCADKGQCLAFLEWQPSHTREGVTSMGLAVDCRNCGCYGEMPSVHPKKENCTCPKECDCQNPPSDKEDGENGVRHISEHCPVHNDYPAPYPECPEHGNG